MEIRLTLPPQPGQLQIRVAYAETRAQIGAVTIHLEVNRKRNMPFECQISNPCSTEKLSIPIPPDQDGLGRIDVDKSCGR